LWELDRWVVVMTGCNPIDLKRCSIDKREGSPDTAPWSHCGGQGRTMGVVDAGWCSVSAFEESTMRFLPFLVASTTVILGRTPFNQDRKLRILPFRSVTSQVLSPVMIVYGFNE